MNNLAMFFIIKYLDTVNIFIYNRIELHLNIAFQIEIPENDWRGLA
jgi:hypothetical protein